MDADELDDLARDPRYIPEIYNYCDKWCTRCPYTARCLDFALHERIWADLPRRIRLRDEAARRAEAAATQEEPPHPADAPVEEPEEPREHEPPPPTGDAPEPMRYFSREEGMEQVLRGPDPGNMGIRDHPACRAAWQYVLAAMTWLMEHHALVQHHLEPIAAQPPDDPAAPDPAEDAVLLRDAIEVIRWYHWAIWTKIARALLGAQQEDPLLGAELADGPSDSDVSAKIALVEMDQSLAAWGDVRRLLPSTAQAVDEMLVHLVRLRRLVEQTFPDARSVVRPGFDAPPPPLEGEADSQP